MTFKKIIPAVMLAICLAACADQTDEAVRTDITAAVSSEAVSEAVSAEEMTAERAETTIITTAETAPLYELDESRKTDRTYAEISDDTPFFSCEYEQTGLVSAGDFADKALIESAKEALLSSEVYTELYDDVKSRLPDREPAIHIGCSKVLAFDLDGNGLDEYAFLFSFEPDFDNNDEEMMMNVWGAIDPNMPYAVVLSGDNGKFYTNSQKYAMNADLYVLNYGGFAQFVVDGGVSNNSSCADYFSYYDGKFELELREFRKYEILDNAFLCQTMAQASNSWIIVWDDDIKAYVTPEAVTVSDEKRDGIFEALPLDKEEKEKYRDFNICIIADYFYSLYKEDNGVRTFVKDENGDFAVYEYSIPYYGIGERNTRYGDPFEISFAKNLEYKNVLEKIKENQNADIYRFTRTL